jgi:hypothetical protein
MNSSPQSAGHVHQRNTGNRRAGLPPVDDKPHIYFRPVRPAQIFPELALPSMKQESQNTRPMSVCFCCYRHSRNGIYKAFVDYSGLILAARITLPHFSVSSSMNFPNSAGVIDIGATPKPRRRDFVFGSARAATCNRYGGLLGWWRRRKKKTSAALAPS